MNGKFVNDYVKDMVSVILLSYNSGDYLYEAIDSIIKQDYPLIELIVTDDGSILMRKMLQTILIKGLTKISRIR